LLLTEPAQSLTPAHPPTQPARNPQPQAGYGAGAGGFGLSAPMASAGLGLFGGPNGQQMGLGPQAGLMGMGAAGLNGANGYGAAAGLQFDPTSAADVDKMNAAFAARQQQLLGGANFLLPRS
jgi:hypothetical protein